MTASTKKVIESLSTLDTVEKQEVLMHLIKLTSKDTQLPENWEKLCLESRKEVKNNIAQLENAQDFVKNVRF